MIRRSIYLPIVSLSVAAALTVAERACFAQPNPTPIFAPSYRVDGFIPQPHRLGTKPQPAVRSGGFYRPFLNSGSRFRGMPQRGFHGSWYFPFAWSTQFAGPMWLPENYPYGSLPGPKPPSSQNSGAGLRGNAPRRVATTQGLGNLRLGSQWPAALGQTTQRPATQRQTTQQPTNQTPPEQPPSRLDPDAPRPADRGVLEVLLPSPNAVVSLDGVKVVGTGEVRALVTPVIETENTYLYRVVATWFKDGKLTTEVREGPILPGELIVVDFADGAGPSATDDAKTPHREAPASPPDAPALQSETPASPPDSPDAQPDAAPTP
jgi:uncharacterized protein (TIGR03000 family)